MNLNYNLEKWLIECNRNGENSHAFPFEMDYPSKYAGIADKLNTWVHPFVNQGSMITDGGFLTDHGPKHIKTVIKRASELTGKMSEQDQLNPFEIYILLMAIHVHDVGNILSRNGHEMNSLIVIEYVRDALVRYDRIEWNAIYNIANAHGGKEKDKISKLPVSEPINNIPVRHQLLAAILKFADELAEDSSRAARYLEVISKLPEHSEIFHQYAISLHSIMVQVENRQISMHFDIEESVLHKTFKKSVKDSSGNSIVIDEYLINEIYIRTLKSHHERMYCMRFLRPYINIDKIRVQLRTTLNNGKEFSMPQGGYDLIETGMNDLHMEQIFQICPELNNWTGDLFSKKIKEFITA